MFVLKFQCQNFSGWYIKIDRISISGEIFAENFDALVDSGNMFLFEPLTNPSDLIREKYMHICSICTLNNSFQIRRPICKKYSNERINLKAFLNNFNIHSRRF